VDPPRAKVDLIKGDDRDVVQAGARVPGQLVARGTLEEHGDVAKADLAFQACGYPGAHVAPEEVSDATVRSTVDAPGPEAGEDRLKRPAGEGGGVGQVEFIQDLEDVGKWDQ
jgi:hypothetical protein